MPPLVICFTLGALWKRGTEGAAFWTLLIGHCLGLSVFVASQLGAWTLHYTINVSIMTAVSAVLFVAISYMGEQTEADEDTLWNRAAAFDTSATNVTFLLNAKTHGWLLAALMLGTLILFW
ncbi:hypothetical protein A8B78_11880 [Jannaschia sp. EhC01]|nr:hypothetical protein A8B78_11880 [Jannaschia sp. EhC01]